MPRSFSLWFEVSVQIPDWDAEQQWTPIRSPTDLAWTVGAVDSAVLGVCHHKELLVPLALWVEGPSSDGLA